MNLLSAIRKDPLNYLPEVSLTALRHFQHGYHFRYEEEGRSLEDEVVHAEFDGWIRNRFGVGPSFFDIMSIVRSFAANETEAFHEYFALRDEFLSTAASPMKVRPEQKQTTAKRTLLDVLKGIRERPPMYLGTTTFCNCTRFLMGEERAYSDLGLPPGEDRRIFSEFKIWVEKEKNRAGRPRPWYVIVSYYGTGCDCGHTVSGAFTLFYRWLDEFALKCGQPDLFRAPVSWWEPRPKHPHVVTQAWP